MFWKKSETIRRTNVFLFIVAFLAVATLGHYFQSNAQRDMAPLAQDAVVQTMVTTGEASSTSKDHSFNRVCIATTTSSTVVRGYTIELKTIDCDNSATLVIKKDNSAVFYVNNHSIYPISIQGWEENQGVPRVKCPAGGEELCEAAEFVARASKDMTGDGVPELVFTGYTGGNHCCQDLYVLSLGQTLSVLTQRTNQWQEQYLTVWPGVTLHDLDKDGTVEIEASVPTFQGWHTRPSYGAYYPTVIYSLQGGTYQMSEKLMRKPAPPDERLRSVASWFTSNDWGEGGATIDGEIIHPWEYAVELIYSGNAVAAKRYIDYVWVENDEFFAKPLFVEELSDQIKESELFTENNYEHAPFFNLEALTGL